MGFLGLIWYVLFGHKQTGTCGDPGCTDLEDEHGNGDRR